MIETPEYGEAVARESVIGDYLSTLEKAVEVLRNELIQLEVRLDAVLCPLGPVDDVPAPAQGHNRSSLGGVIRFTAESIFDMCERTRHLSARVDL